MAQTTTRPDRREVPPREDLRRMTPFEIRADDDAEPGDGLTLDGFAAVFNRETKIDSWEGRFKETIARGSMRKSFSERTPKLQFDHGYHPLIGSIPIGQVESVAERTDADRAPDGGAHVVARLHDNWLVEPVRDAIASRSVNGMSFRFSVVRDEWRDADGNLIKDEEVLRDLLRRSWMEDLPDEELLLRTLRELKVPELGPVVWPAYDDTSVDVRSTLTIDLGRLSEDREARFELARAVMHADRIEAAHRDEEVAPRATDDQSAGEHAPSPDDTPRSTEPDPGSAGEHESRKHLSREHRAMWVRKARDIVLDFDRKERG